MIFCQQSRYLFACISLGKLDSAKLQSCFETLHQEHLALTRKIDMSLQIPLLPSDRTEERIRTKWLTVLLELIGRNLRCLNLQINLAPTSAGIDTSTNAGLASLAMLAQTAETYSLSLDFNKWKEAGRSSSRFFPIFAHPVLSSLSTNKVQVLKIVNFNSHFGKRSVGGDHADHLLDFTEPSPIERDLINKLEALKDITALHLSGCTFSSHFSIPFSFNLVVLEFDFEGSKDCQHNANHKLAVSLIQANRETLQELSLKGWTVGQNDVDGAIDLPSLRILSVDLITSPCVDLPHKSLQSPNLTRLSIKRACLHNEVYATLTNTLATFSKLKYLEIENCVLHDEDMETVEEFVAKCARQDIVLNLVWPRNSQRDQDHHYDIYHHSYHLVPLQNCIQKIAFRLAPGDVDDELPGFEMPILQYLRLSFTFSPSDATKRDVHRYGLPSDVLMPFLEDLEAPMLETMEINFSSPFIDYIQTFARFIGSGGFNTKFPMCKEIKGTITADTQTLWDGNSTLR